MLDIKSIDRLTWLKCAVFLAITFVYLFFAPNYEWKSKFTEAAYGADFLQEWVGARMLITGNGSQLYNVGVFQAWQYDRQIVGFTWESDQYFPPVYPPPHYVLFSPFACLPYRWATVVWLVCLIAAAFVCTKLISDIAIWHGSKRGPIEVQAAMLKSRYLWIGLLLFPSLLFSITLGQKSVYWLLVVCITWRLLQSNRDFASGMVFGFLSIKPTLFFLLPFVMLRNRRWRFFAGAIVSACTIWGTTACIVPFDTWIAFARGLTSVGSYAENAGYRIDWSCNLMTLAYSLPPELTHWCKWSICLPLSIYILYCVFEDRTFSIDSPETVLKVLGATLLISPHTYHYDLCVLLLPILWLATNSTRQGIVYYAILSLGVTIAGDLQELLHIPVIPILLIGIICELRLRGLSLSEPKQSPEQLSSKCSCYSLQ